MPPGRRRHARLGRRPPDGREQADREQVARPGPQGRAHVRPTEQAAQAREVHVARGRGEGRRGEALHAARPARPRRRHGRARPHLRQDRGALGAAEARRRRPRHRGGPAPRARHPGPLRARAPGRARARGREEGGAHPRRGRPPRPRARVRVEARGGLLVPPRRRRRLLPRGVRRAPARRAEGHLLRLHVPLPGLLRGPGRRRRARDDRQRPRLPLGRVQRAAGVGGRPPPLHAPLQPLAERQGRAHEPDARPGVAVRACVGQRGGQGRGPAPPPPAIPIGCPRGGVGGPGGRGGRRPCPPTSSITIGAVRTARAGACRPCRASSASTTCWHTTSSALPQDAAS